MYLYQKGNYDGTRRDALKFAREHYFSGHEDSGSVQGNFNLITSFIQKAKGEHIPFKTCWSDSAVPWITSEITQKNLKENQGSCKGQKDWQRKFPIFKQEIKVDMRKQHYLYVTNLVGDISANPCDFYRYINGQEKDTQGYSSI